MDNIFQIGGQVFGESFIGRKALVQSIRQIFLESPIRTAKSIVGLTRTGKSSLVKNIFYDLPANIIYIYEDLNEWSSYYELWQDICFEIADYLQKNNNWNSELSDYLKSLEEEQIPWIKMNRNIKKIFGYLAEKNIKTILVLDEFDHAAILFDQGTKQFELFRTIFSDGRYNVSAITISRRNLYTIEGATYQSSTFHGILDTLPFKGFDQTDMDEYFSVFQKQNILLDDQQKRRIIFYAGNAPYLLSILGHYIIETAKNQESIDIDKIFLDKCKAINDYYRDCIKHLERDRDLQRIIPFIIGPNIGVTQNDKDELFNLGYFREENGRLIVISEYFMAFLSTSRLEISLWDNLIHLEKKIKQIIERDLSKIIKYYGVCGETLNEILKNILQKVPDIQRGDISRYDSFIANNQKVFHLESTYLQVMSLNDALKIIKDCWTPIFSSYFNNHLYSEWEYKFKKCVMARNPIAHGQEEYLTDLDKQEVDTYCKQLFDILSETISSADTQTISLIDETKKFSPTTPSFSYEIPIPSFIGHHADMLILERGGQQKNNLRGVIANKYRAVIPKNYLQNKDLNVYLHQTIKVVVEKINSNSLYEVRPLLEQ